MSGNQRSLVRPAAAGFCCLALAVLAPAAPPDLAGELVPLARARQEKVKSLDVTLKQTDALSPGALSKGNAAFSPVPRERTVLTWENRLLLRGNSVRYEGSGLFKDRDRKVRPQRRIDAFDGTVNTSFLPDGITGDGASTAVIKREDPPRAVEASAPWPLLAAFRGLEPTLARDDLRQLTPSDDTISLSGVSCRRFDRERAGAHKERFWIDAAGLIRRAQSEQKGQLLSQTNIRYEPRYGLDAFPVSWTTAQYSRAGTLQIQRTLEVVAAAINQPITDADFDLRFPPGCHVMDSANGTEYVVQPDGSKAEPEPPRAESPPQEEGGPLARYGGPIALCLAALLVVIVAGCLTRVRWRNGRSRPPSRPA